MADQNYWDWYAGAFGQQPQQPEVLPQVNDWNAFYKSVGIQPNGVGSPTTTRSVSSVPVNLPPLPRPVPERATTIATYPTQTVSDLVRGNAPQHVPDRLTPSAGLPANFGTMSPQQVAQIGVGLSPNVNELGLRVTDDPLRIVVNGATPLMASAKTAPVPFPPYRNVGSQTATMPPMPIRRPGNAPSSVASALLASQPQQQPLRIVVNGGAPLMSQAPVPQQRPQQSLYYTNPQQFGNEATRQSGDTSVGSQADAAASRSAGEGGRNRRY